VLQTQFLDHKVVLYVNAVNSYFYSSSNRRAMRRRKTSNSLNEWRRRVSKVGSFSMGSSGEPLESLSPPKTPPNMLRRTSSAEAIAYRDGEKNLFIQVPWTEFTHFSEDN
jgi:hypothetical protein